MSKKHRKAERAAQAAAAAAAAAAAPPNEFSLPWWTPLAALAAVLVAYWPALRGAPIFDDFLLPVFRSGHPPALLSYFGTGRPFYYISLHLNYLLSGKDTLSYHLTNVLLHFADSCLAYFIVRKALELTGSARREASLLACFGGLLFLLHPVQVESVAFIASRSESLSTLCAYSALALLLAAGDKAVGWRRAASIVALLCAGVMVKEHVVAMAAVLILADWLLKQRGNLRGIVPNWRLHGVLAAGALVTIPALAIYVTRHSSSSAGFSVPGTNWYRYLFTQFEAIWIYLRLFVCPVNQSLDYNFPMATSFFEPFVMLAFAGLMTLLFLAWRYRARFPLASLGLVLFLVLLAPTSSVVPIADAVTERRLYLPFLGLLLIAVELLRHWPASHWKTALIGTVLAALTFGTWNYSHAFSSESAIWEHAVASKPENPRPRIYLGSTYVKDHRCAEAVKVFAGMDTGANGEKLGKNAFLFYMNYGAALECSGDYDRAENAYREAIKIAPSVRGWAPLQDVRPMFRGWRRLAALYMNEGRWDDALDAAKEATQVNPRAAWLVDAIQANIDLSSGRPEEAAAGFRRALQVRPRDATLQKGLARATQAVEAHPPGSK